MFNDRVEDHVITTKSGNRIIRYRFDTSFIPELVGSEKQIRWATNVRNKLLATLRYTIFGRLGGDEFIDAYGNTKSAHRTFQGREIDGIAGEIMTDSCEMYATIARLSKDMPDADWDNVLMFLVSITDSKVWIEHRDILAVDTAPGLLLAAREACLRGPLKEAYSKFAKTRVAA